MTQAVDYRALATRVHKANMKWWIDPFTHKPVVRNLGNLCMLVTSELAEAMEGERKNKFDDHLPHRKQAEVELADVVIRLLDMYGAPPDRTARRLIVGDADYEDRLYEQYSNPSYNVATVFYENVIDASDRGEMLFAINKILVSFQGIPYHSNLLLLIRMCEFYCKTFGHDLWGAFEEKMAYNAERADHKLENRIKDGGKKW
jgi:hypothetical protein